MEEILGYKASSHRGYQHLLTSASVAHMQFYSINPTLVLLHQPNIA